MKRINFILFLSLSLSLSQELLKYGRIKNNFLISKLLLVFRSNYPLFLRVIARSQLGCSRVLRFGRSRCTTPTRAQRRAWDVRCKMCTIGCRCPHALRRIAWRDTHIKRSYRLATIGPQEPWHVDYKFSITCCARVSWPNVTSLETIFSVVGDIRTSWNDLARVDPTLRRARRARQVCGKSRDPMFSHRRISLPRESRSGSCAKWINKRD